MLYPLWLSCSGEPQIVDVQQDVLHCMSLLFLLTCVINCSIRHEHMSKILGAAQILCSPAWLTQHHFACPYVLPFDVNRLAVLWKQVHCRRNAPKS